MKERAIEVSNLKKYFKDVKAVDDISFSVEQGELFGFLGVNGAGKSTVINILCTLYKKTAEACVFWETKSERTMKKFGRTSGWFIRKIPLTIC